MPEFFSGTSGRPKFNIPYDQLNFLVERGFTFVKTAELLGISVRTAERRFQDFGLNCYQLPRSTLYLR